VYQVGFYLHDYIEMHGQQNIKKIGGSISKGRPSLAVLLTSNLHVTSVCFIPQHVTALLSQP